MALTGIGKQPYQKLEEEFARFVRTKYAVSCSSGTAALTLALAGLGIGKGDEVIVPEFTMIATAWAVTYLGAKPVFVDCDDTLNIDITKLAHVVSGKTKAIMPVHIYGRMARMDDILEFAELHDLMVIEDACEAHGAHINGKMAGSFGDAGCFSLFRNKIVSSEEGGIVTTDSYEAYGRMQDLKSMAFGTEHDYLHKEMGWNFRITNMQAKVALESLMSIQANLKRREEIRQLYDDELGEFTIHRPEGSVIWMYDLIAENRDELLEMLLRDGVAARHFFKPMSMQPMYLDEYEDLKAYWYSQYGLYLPVHPSMSNEQVKNIAKKVRKKIHGI